MPVEILTGGTSFHVDVTARQRNPRNALRMKRIEAIIKSAKLGEVKALLLRIGARGMTVSGVRGFARTGGRRQVLRGSGSAVDFLPKVRIQIVVHDEMVRAVVDAILADSRTGKIVYGKISISPIEEVIRIRTGERGEEAI
jgi:nitrogen regulatory protein P-II 1